MVLRFLFIAFLLLLGCGSLDLEFNNPNDPRNFSHPSGIAYQPFTDPRDGKTYNSVVIGEQTWMAENLNYVPPWEGAKDDFLCAGTDNFDVEKETLVSNGDYCDIYGRLYKWAGWDIAINACPSGWHLPSANEWQILLKFIDPNCSDLHSHSYQASSKLRATSGWPYLNEKGTDDYGFTAIYFLNRNTSGGSCWWSSTREESGRNEAYSLIISTYNGSDYAVVYEQDYISKCSIRCIKDGGINYQTCNNQFYDPATQRCNDNVVETRCGAEWYALSVNQRCENDVLEMKCGTGWYNYDPKTQYCNGSSIKPYGKLTDERDGKTYKTIEIGTQTWMAENLSYNDVSGSVCYDRSEANCTIYGRLYVWETATSACPSDWHLPNDADWNVLMKFINPSCSDNKDCAGAGTTLKAESSWESYNGVPKGDNYNFSALPGGEYNSNGSFGYVGYIGSWWSASKSGSDNAAYRYMSFDNEKVGYSNYGKSSYGRSVRCVKDSE